MDFNIDLSKYKLISPSSIIKRRGKKIMYDIKINKNKTFIINTETINILSHNCDGHHIGTLLVNFFYKWFPYIIEEGRLFKLVTPLVVCDYKNNRKYFLSLEEFNKFANNHKISNINYLKGLGSLSISDWENVMNDKKLFQIIKDCSSKKFLEIAFGDSSQKRKEFLEGK